MCVHLTNMHRVACEGTRLLVQQPVGMEVPQELRTHPDPCWCFCSGVLFCAAAYNKQDTHGKSWADPKIFDAPLTQRGRQQVRKQEPNFQTLV